MWSNAGADAAGAINAPPVRRKLEEDLTRERAHAKQHGASQAMQG
jgi:hypothetical protein